MMKVKIILLLLSIAAAGCAGNKYLRDFSARTLHAVPTFVEPIQITAGNESNYSPSIAPNGAYVIYASDRSGNKDIWERSTRGGFGKPLTTHSADDFSPSISPKGEKVAFVSRRSDAAGDIHILDLGPRLNLLSSDGEGSMERLEARHTEDTNPSWFPSGERIVYSARSSGKSSPQIMTAFLSDLKPSPLEGAKGDQPTVSPDGKSIAYVSDGNILIYDLAGERVSKVTSHSSILDGQPRFSPDGKELYFIRYSDDTNRDGKLDADDRSTICKVDLEFQTNTDRKESFGIQYLTSAHLAAYSPQLRGRNLFFTVQAKESLDIFKLPASGHVDSERGEESYRAEIAKEKRISHRVFWLRSAQTKFAKAGDFEVSGRFALEELRLHRRYSHKVEAKWLYEKIRKNFSGSQDLLGLAKLEILDMALAPISYPKNRLELTKKAQRLLARVKSKLEKMEESELTAEVRGYANLLKAKIFAIERNFFAANDLLASLVDSNYPDLSGESEFYLASITMATGSRSAAIKRFQRVIERHSANSELVRRASRAAVEASLSGVDVPIDSLQALRSTSRELPVLAAMAHVKIAEQFLDQGNEVVATNEFREIITLYAGAPSVILPAAKNLSSLEERAGRYNSAQKMYTSLLRDLQDSTPSVRSVASEMETSFKLRRGNYLLRQLKFEKALSVFQSILTREPENVSAHRGRIRASFEMGNHLNLLDVYRGLFDKNPDSAAFSYLYGYALTFLADSEDELSSRIDALKTARSQLLHSRSISNQLLQIHQTLGWTNLQLGQWIGREQKSGAWRSEVRSRWHILLSFFGADDPNWNEQAIDSFLTAYYLSRDGSVEKAEIAQNLAETYYDLKNYQKALHFYLKRIQMLAVIPMPSKSLEALLWQNAGRAAFHNRELEISEDLQRNVIAHWEGKNKDGKVARSLDSLALTLRLRGEFAEAYEIYQRLNRISIRTKLSENLVGIETNLAYCAFEVGRFSDALAHIEAAVASIQGETDSQKHEEAVVVKVSGGDTSSLGFDSNSHLLLLWTLKAKIYKKAERRDLAIEALKQKLLVLKKIQLFGIESNDQENSYKVDEIAILQSQISKIQVDIGEYHSASLRSFSSSEVARGGRLEAQRSMAKAEWVNYVNYARVNLRLASMGVLGRSDAQKIAGDLLKKANEFEELVKSGSREDRLPLGQLLGIYGRFVALYEDGGSRASQNDAALVRSLGLLDSISSPKMAAGPLLALNHIGNTSSLKLTPATLGSMKKFKRTSIRNPKINWLLYASRSQWKHAFDAAAKLIETGGNLESATTRRAFRVVFENYLYETPAGEGFRLLRKYFYLLSQNLINQLPGDDSTKQNGLSGRFRSLAKINIQDGHFALMVHQDLAGKIHVGVSDGASSYYEGGGASLDPKSMADQITDVLSSVPLQYKDVHEPLYVIPSHDLVKTNWSEVYLDGSALADYEMFSQLPALEFAPIVKELYRRPNSNVALIGDHEGLGLAGTKFDVNEFAGLTASQGRAFGHDVLIVNKSLHLNSMIPTESVFQNESTTSESAIKGVEKVENLDTKKFGAISTLVLPKVVGSNDAMHKSGESNEGWRYLAITAINSGAASIIYNNSHIPPPPEQSRKLWPIFFSSFDDASIGNSRLSAGPGLTLIGFPGVALEETKRTETNDLREAMEEAEASFDDGEWGEARQYYHDALYFASKSSDSEAVDDALEGLVNSNYKAKEFLAAFKYKMRIVSRIQAAITRGGEAADFDQMDLAEAVMDAAVLAVRGKEFVKGHSLLNRAEKIFESEEETQLLGKVHHYRGINWENQGDFAKTIDSYKKSHALYDGTDRKKAAMRLLDLANVYRNKLSDYTAALNYYERALGAFRQIDDDTFIKNTLIDKANTLMSAGRLRDSIRILKQDVLARIDVAKAPWEWSRAAEILANAYYRAGMYQNAMDLNKKTAGVAHTIRQVDRRVLVELNLENMQAMVLSKLGRYEESFQIFEKSIKTAKTKKLMGKVALLYNNYGFWIRESGDIERSIKYFEIARKIDTDLGDISAIAFDQRNLALSLIARNSLNEAAELLNSSIATSKERGLIYNLLYCYLGLGDIHLRLGMWEEAEKSFSEALVLARTSSMQDFVWRAHSGMGVASWRAGNRQSAKKSLAEAIAIVEEMRAGLKSEKSKYQFQSDRGVQEVYQDYVSLLMELGESEAAWHAARRSRGRNFVDSIGKAKLEFANELQSRLAEGVRSADRDEDRHAARLSVEKNAPELLKFVRPIRVSLDAVQKALPDTSALLEYYVTPKLTYIWRITRRELKGYSLEISGDDLEELVSDFRVLIDNYSTTQFLGKELTDILLAEVLDNLGDVENLIFVPHQGLHYLSFATLPFGEGYLLDRYNVSYSDNAEELVKWNASGPRSLNENSSVLALANPSNNKENLADLPFAEKEVVAMERYFKNITKSVGKSASKEFLKKHSTSYDIIHIAAHAKFDWNSPANSALYLASSSTDQGRLRVRDIYGMPVTADLVTLSACTSGLGELGAIGELVGMNAAFKFSGASTVISSMWRVSDVASAVVMKRFYRGLSEGKPRALALREAQVLVKKYFAHPAYWGGFKLNGEYR